jgi:TetR/AcrR family transcriptional repressor of nem operon
MIWDNSYHSVGVDAICQAAGVRKGTFYHFFKSKAELSANAIEDHWNDHKKLLDRIFGAQCEPLEKLDSYFLKAYEFQKDRKRITGYVCGCPYFNLGLEVTTLEPDLLTIISAVIDQYLHYFKTAISEAEAGGHIQVDDLDRTARRLLSLFEGTLMMARVNNNTELLLDLPYGARKLLGVPLAVK